MKKPRVCVLRAPGTNCDVETAFAFDACGAEPHRLHVFRLLEKPALLAEYQALCLPGGFSYGDDIGAGVIFSRQLQGRLAEAIAEFLQADKLVLGICNGFQVLLKSGILPGGGKSWPPDETRRPVATLTWNDNGKYTALWVHLRVNPGRNVFLRGIDEIELPVAHGEGRIAVRDETVLDDWERNGQIVLTYHQSGEHVGLKLGSTATAARAQAFTETHRTQTALAERPAVLPFPYNPNGSVANIAGLGDPTGRVLGLMPHPERFLFATQHPQWTRRKATGEGDGMRLFRNAVEYFR
jgi:phosphoribosylformylglycinamidine synthase